jgi:hypothetical protein
MNGSDTTSDRRRERFAEVVHKAVLEYTGSADGFGKCELYALAGMAALLTICPADRVLLAVGTLALLPDPDDPTLWFFMDAEKGGRKEFHAWNWLLKVPGDERGAEVVDFSARHYDRYPTRCGLVVGAGEKMEWNRPRPPPCLWCAYPAAVPDYVRFGETDVLRTQDLYRRIPAHKPLYRLVAGLLREGGTAAAPPPPGDGKK